MAKLIDVRPQPVLARGTDGDDVLVGTDQADTFFGSKGNDSIDGRAGIDTASYEKSPFIVNNVPNSVVLPQFFAGVAVDLETGTATKNAFTFNVRPDGTIEIVHETFTDQLISVENATGGAGMDTLLGSSGTNVLSGLGGEDTIHGRDGKDTIFGGEDRDLLFGGSGGDVLFGGAENDVLSGGAGADKINGGTNGIEISTVPILPQGVLAPSFSYVVGDLATYSESAAGVTVDLSKKGPQSGGDAQGDELIDVESVAGSAFDDSISVNGGHAYGNAGNDMLYGGINSDALIGGAGGDKLYGGGGDDYLIGDEQGEDVTSGPTWSMADELYGGDGNDFLAGGIGADLLDGGAGNDIYSMVETQDVIVDSSGIDTVMTAESLFTLNAGLENLVFRDSDTPADHTGYGNAGDNLLLGGEGNDTLFAGAGSDTLNGGLGNDSYGDLIGNDTIVFSEGTDWAFGFGASAGTEQDVIDMSDRGYTSLQDFYDQGGTIVQVGMDTQIQLYDGGPTLVLQGVSAVSIDESDFRFI